MFTRIHNFFHKDAGRIIIFLSAIFLCSYIPVQRKSGNESASLLWRISGKDLKKPSYIFGTMHLICRQDYVWTSHMEKSLTEADKICLEMDMDDPDVITKVSAGLIDKSGKKLRDYFTPEQYKILKKYAKDSLGIDLGMFQQMKPIALEGLMATNSTDCPDPVSYEDSIMKVALMGHKEVLGLELPEEQIAVLESISSDTIVKYLMEEIQSSATSNTEYTQLVTAYRNQDIRALYDLLNDAHELGDMGVFLDGRNKKWITRMADQMKKGSIFYAVGAGHLWGDNGVLELLRKNGYTVVAAQ